MSKFFKPKPSSCSLSGTSLLAALLTGGALAGTPVISADNPSLTAPAAASSLWEVTVRPYSWLAGVEGTTGVRGHTADTDMSFEDIFKNLEMTASLQAEVRRDRWMLLLDGMYLRTSADVQTPGRLLSTVDVGMEQIMAEASIGYRLWESGKGFVDIFAGGRYMNLGADLDFELDSPEVESFSQNLAAEAAARVASVVRHAVGEAQAKVKSRAVDAAESALRQREGQALANHPGLPAGLELLQRSDGPVSEAIRELAGARAAELEKTALNAETAASATRSRLRGKAGQALSRAEKKLARRIEEAVRNAVPDKVSGSRSWVDPIIGIRARYNLSSRFYASARADTGGFGVSSDLAWQAYAGLAWQCGRNLTLELGYRCLQMDYTSGGFTYNTRTAGIFTGVSMTF